MKTYALAALCLITGCTTKVLVPTPSEENAIIIKAPEVKKVEKVEIKKPEIKKPEIKKIEPKVEIKPEVKVEEDEPENDRALKRQIFFAVACEENPIVKGIAAKYKRSIKSFSDGKIETQSKSINGFSTIRLTYQITMESQKTLADVTCVFSESVVQNKPQINLVTLTVNGINVK